MKISIKFSLATGKASDLPIRMRIGYAGLRLDLRTGFVCPPEKWDAESMRMKAGTSNRYKESAATINRELSKQEAIISEILARYDLDGSVPEPSVLKSDFDLRTGRAKKDTPSAGTSLFDAIGLYLSDPMFPKESATARTYISLQNKLRDIELDKVLLDDVSESVLSRLTGELHQDELENQTVDMYLTKLRAVLRYASQKDLYHGRLHETFRPKLKGLGKKDVHYLEWSEFEKILHVPLVNANMEAVRDAFCFCCATGLRVSDCSRLMWSQVHLSCDTPFISLVAKKTTKPTIIELNQYSRAIIERQLSFGARQDGLVFAPFSLTARNYIMREVAKAAGIKGKVRDLSFKGNKVIEEMVDKANAITSHWGRHTFIVHALSLGISPVVVMQWTGHSSFESMKPYVAIADTAKKQNMELFNKAPEKAPGEK